MGGSFSTTRAFNPQSDIGDLSGKVVIVTGSNSGIGYQVLVQLVAHGARVYMATRNETRARAGIERLAKELQTHGLTLGVAPCGTVEYLHLDTLTIEGSKASAQEFLKRENRLDLLVNNAGGITAEHAVSPDGINVDMTVNFVGPFFFTNKLLPLLIKTAEEPGSDVRIVHTSSLVHDITAAKGMKYASIDDLNVAAGPGLINQQKRYATAKLNNILHSYEIQRRLLEQNSSVISLSVNPGVVASEGLSGLIADMNGIKRLLFSIWLRFSSTTVEDGALTTLWAATSPKVRSEPETYRGSYLVPVGKLAKASTQARDPKLAADLWRLTESLDGGK